MAKVIWTEKSEKSLRAIHDYIYKDSKFYAGRFINSLIKSTEKLELFPLMGRVVPEFNKDNIRELIYYNYRIVYKVNIDLVEILLIINSAKDFEKNFKKDWEI